MPRTLINPQHVAHQGTVVALVAADAVNGNNFSPGGQALLYVSNTSGSGIVVTIHSNVTIDGIVLGNIVVTVAPNAVEIFGPFPPQFYAQSDGTVWVDFGAAAQVTVLTVGP